MASNVKANKKPSLVTPETAKVENLEQHSNTMGGGRKLTPCEQQMDVSLKPIWASLTPKKARIVFQRLGRDIGQTRYFAELCESYLRYLRQGEGSLA